jgi:hypothetical protein
MRVVKRPLKNYRIRVLRGGHGEVETLIDVVVAVEGLGAGPHLVAALVPKFVIGAGLAMRGEHTGKFVV